MAEQADIVHLYNYLDLHSTDFAPVDFRSLHHRGVRFVRMFESTPMRVAEYMGQQLEDVLNDPIPKLVIAQYPERFLPTARVVPNIVPQSDRLYSPPKDAPVIDVVFSPSWRQSAWAARWDTKGLPETEAMLADLGKQTGANYRVIQGQPLREVMHAKQQAKLVIDELVTGSYHLSGLEGLSLAKPVLAFLDGRTERVLREITGADTCPFINVRLEDAFEVLVHLLQHPDEAAEIGRASREWIERFWSDRILVRHFVDVYEKLLTDPCLVTRQESLRLDDSAVRFHALTLPDLVHRARAHRYDTEPSITGDGWKRPKRLISWLRAAAVKYPINHVTKSLRAAQRIMRSLLVRGAS
ncbi:glycosyltransferase [Chloroflexota bacterium]